MTAADRYKTDPAAHDEVDAMLVYVIDEEASAELIKSAVREAAPQAEVRQCHDYASALKVLRTEYSKPDAVFAGADLPGSGTGFAAELKKFVPMAYIVLTSADKNHALAAWQLHVNGFLLKPLTIECILEELRLYAQRRPEVFDGEEKEKLKVRCFGYFEVFSGEKPLLFKRSRSRELLAFLIDRRGAACSAEAVIATLYEDVSMQDMKKAKQNIRNLVSDLKTTLMSVGQESVLIRKGGSLAVRADRIDCDYYRLLDGEDAAIASYRGEYMEQYSWAERTKGSLEFDLRR